VIQDSAQGCEALAARIIVRVVLVLAVVLTGCAVGSFFAPAKSSQPQPAPAPKPLTKALADHPTPYGIEPLGKKSEFVHLPATSCAAASCHGGGQVGTVGSEHSTWAPEVSPEGGARDPHSKAYSVLFNAESVRMAQTLDPKIPAHENPLCLKCHAVDGAKDAETQKQMNTEGVGCGACHGRADKWLTEHYLPEWQTLTPRQKWDKYGFVPAENIVARTMNCVRCHVGDADREVNHDLIAAGHPRLAFESARFHYNPQYRKHWTEKAKPLDFEVRAWIVGQAATLRAAVVVLKTRAELAKANKAPWPEFAGYSCYACHQTVGDKDIRSGVSITRRKLGVPGWELWSNTAVRVAADYCSDAYFGLGLPELKTLRLLRATMDSSVSPKLQDVIDDADDAIKELDAWLLALQDAGDKNGRSVPEYTPRDIVHALAGNALGHNDKKETKLADHDWDALAANYLGCAAMYHATGGEAGGNTWGKELKAIRANLRFPLTGKKGEWFDSPALFTRDKLNQLTKDFMALRKATESSGGKR
ncbi:MAG: cytochrome c family protein, partial [Planctomycetia bacterium]|nr:cytochrome c family protein [Planctomycetia bacterium]